MAWPLVTRKSLQGTFEKFISSDAPRLWVHGVEGSGARTALQQSYRNAPVAYFDFRQEGAVNDRIMRQRLVDEIVPQVAKWSGDKSGILAALRSRFDVDNEIIALKERILHGSRPAKVNLKPVSLQKLRSARTAEEIWNSLMDEMSSNGILDLVASLNESRQLTYILGAASVLRGSFLFCGVDELFRSPFYSDGKKIFEDIDACAKAIFHTSDALTFIGCCGEAPAVTIDEWPEELARSVAQRIIKDLDDNAWKGVYAGVGGHPAHLRRTLEGLRLAQMTPQPKIKTHREDVEITDELKSELERDDTLMSLRDVSPLEKYLRTQHVDHMSTELNVIDWRIQQFEANALIQQDSMMDKVQLYEGIRHICKKHYLPVPSDFNIEHDHVTALLDANLLVPKFSPSRVVVANELTRHALIAHCTMKYEEQTLRDKLEYNLHVWKHRKDMVYSLDHLAH